MVKLTGHLETEKALKRLDKLMAEEAQMAIVQNVQASCALDVRVRDLGNIVT